MTDYFRLGGTDFGVDRSASSVEVSADALVTVIVQGRTEAVRRQGDADPFGWASHPPMLYVRVVPAIWTGGVATVRIDDELSDGYDVGLYLHGHGDVTGELTLDPPRAVRVSGSARVGGRAERLDVRVELPLPTGAPRAARR